MKSVRWSRKGKYVPPEELRARILNVRRRYFISRTDDHEKSYIDDEAEIEIDAVIKDVSGKYRKHPWADNQRRLAFCEALRSGGQGANDLLRIRDHARQPAIGTRVLAPRALLERPRLISDGAKLLELTFTPMKRGFADLLSLHITDEPTVPPA